MNWFTLFWKITAYSVRVAWREAWTKEMSEETTADVQGRDDGGLDKSWIETVEQDSGQILV